VSRVLVDPGRQLAPLAKVGQLLDPLAFVQAKDRPRLKRHNSSRSREERKRQGSLSESNAAHDRRQQRETASLRLPRAVAISRELD
jgi:hypothetical protein